MNETFVKQAETDNAPVRQVSRWLFSVFMFLSTMELVQPMVRQNVAFNAFTLRARYTEVIRHVSLSVSMASTYIFSMREMHILYSCTVSSRHSRSVWLAPRVVSVVQSMLHKMQYMAQMLQVPNALRADSYCYYLIYAVLTNHMCAVLTCSIIILQLSMIYKC